MVVESSYLVAVDEVRPKIIVWVINKKVAVCVGVWLCGECVVVVCGLLWLCIVGWWFIVVR